MFRRIFRKKGKPAPVPEPASNTAPQKPPPPPPTPTIDIPARRVSSEKPIPAVVVPQSAHPVNSPPPPPPPARPRVQPPPGLLPVQDKEDEGKLCLVLDMDETLIHCAFLDMQEEKFRQTAGEDRKTDYSTPVDHRFEVSNFHVEVRCRPGLDHFLEQCAQMFELVVFTASLEEYATKAMDLIDPRRLVKHRLYRPATVTYRGVDFVKDLSRLGRDMQRIILIDNNHLAMLASPHNSIAINDFMGDPCDTELMGALETLTTMKDLADVRPFIKERFQTHLDIEDIVTQILEDRPDVPQGMLIDTTEADGTLAPLPTTPKRISRPPDPIPADAQTEIIPSDVGDCAGDVDPQEIYMQPATPITPRPPAKTPEPGMETEAQLLRKESNPIPIPTHSRPPSDDDDGNATPKVLVATFSHGFATPLRQIPCQFQREDLTDLSLPASIEERVARSLSRQLTLETNNASPPDPPAVTS